LGCGNSYHPQNRELWRIERFAANAGHFRADALL
jgi:hypothetical protein